jgi:septum formation protein
MHEVITAVSLNSPNKSVSFYAVTEVWFKTLRIEEIDYYVNKFKPIDKAGAYGAQEWIGYIGVEKIYGSYFNVMGLPLNELYEELMVF